MKFTALKTTRAERLIDELDRIQKQVRERAYEIFKHRGEAIGAALDDWLAAERQTVWKPAIEICEAGNQVVVEAAVAGVEPRDLDIQITSDTLLIRAKTLHSHTEKKGKVHVCEFQAGELFRLIKWPAPIDVDAVKAEHRHGLLRITADVAVGRQAKKVEVQAA